MRRQFRSCCAVAFGILSVLVAVPAYATPIFTQSDLSAAQSEVSFHTGEINAIHNEIQIIDGKIGDGYLYNSNGDLYAQLQDAYIRCRAMYGGNTPSTESCARDAAEAYEQEFNSLLGQRTDWESVLSTEYAALDAAQANLAYVSENCCIP